MKKIAMIIVICAVMFFLPCLAMAKPNVVIDQSVFTFESVPEGESVYHEFILKNAGDTLLTITNVVPP